MTDNDRQHLARAVALAREHMELGQGGPFGAVVVRDGVVLAEGWNEVTSANDPTAHAEIVAIRRAAQSLAAFSLEHAVIYASCEPCPMCLAAIYWARIARIVYAATRAEAAAIGFDDDLIYREIPRPPAERLVPALHLPLAESNATFAAWLAKVDRAPY